MKYSVSDLLYRIARRAVLATYMGPVVVPEVFGKFLKLLSDDGNFVDPKTWKTKEDGKTVVPFSFSEKGLDKARELFTGESEDVYTKGLSGVNEEKYSLTYFLITAMIDLDTKTGTLLFKIDDELEKEKSVWDSGMLKDLKKKLEGVKAPHKVREVNTKISNEDPLVAKKELKEFLQEVQKEYEDLKFTPEELKFLGSFSHHP